jgi:hypothetical protein
MFQANHNFQFEKLQQLTREERLAHEQIRQLRQSMERDIERTRHRYEGDINRHEQRIIRLGREISELEKEIAREKN